MGKSSVSVPADILVAMVLRLEPEQCRLIDADFDLDSGLVTFSVEGDAVPEADKCSARYVCEPAQSTRRFEGFHAMAMADYLGEMHERSNVTFNSAD